MYSMSNINAGVYTTSVSVSLPTGNRDVLHLHRRAGSSAAHVPQSSGVTSIRRPRRGRDQVDDDVHTADGSSQTTHATGPVVTAGDSSESSPGDMPSPIEEGEEGGGEDEEEGGGEEDEEEGSAFLSVEAVALDGPVQEVPDLDLAEDGAVPPSPAASIGPDRFHVNRPPVQTASPPVSSDPCVTRVLPAHRQEVCGLKWSPDYRSLASGGNDNKLYIWDMVAATEEPLWCFSDHKAAVKAISWSPHQSGLLASGGGTADRHIRFWNTMSGTPLHSIDTGSQVWEDLSGEDQVVTRMGCVSYEVNSSTPTSISPAVLSPIRTCI